MDMIGRIRRLRVTVWPWHLELSRVTPEHRGQTVTVNLPLSR